VEIQLKAKIHGDLTIGLLYVLTFCSFIDPPCPELAYLHLLTKSAIGTDRLYSTLFLAYVPSLIGAEHLDAVHLGR